MKYLTMVVFYLLSIYSVNAQTLPQSIAVPSYFYPGPLWSQMAEAGSAVGLTIINPSSGPGRSMDSNYLNEVRQMHASGIRVIGYVYSKWATRKTAQLKADIDKYFAWYEVDGIFIDEVNTSCLKQNYYAELNTYIKSKLSNAITAINPGTQIPECYASVSNIIVNFEGTYEEYQDWSPLGWEARYAPSRFWHLIYATGQTDLQAAIQLSQQRGAGWVYVTPDKLPNPWDTLPIGNYWEEELRLASGR